MERKKIIVEAPDKYGLPTDDELEAEMRTELEKRKAQRDADYKKKDDERIAKETEEKKKAELKAQAQKKLSELGDNPDFYALFDAFVPDSGASESLGGELVRAVNKLEYRWFNDGERFFEDYGLRTAGSAAAFICDNLKGIDDDVVALVKNAANDNADEDDYDSFIEKLKESIVDLLLHKNPELLMKPLGKKDILSWCEYPDEYWECCIPEYEYSLGVSEDSILYAFIENDVIDSFDVKDWIENNLLYDFKNAYVDNPWGHHDDEYTIEGLSRSELEQLSNWDKENIWEDYEKELVDKYGDPHDYADDEDEETDESLGEGIVGGGEHKEFTRDELRDLEDKLYTVLAKEDIYPEDGTFSNSSNRLADLELTLIIDGDWKHDHLYVQQLVENFCNENNMIVVKHQEIEIGKPESDWYKSQHTWFIDVNADGKGKERLSSLRGMFN